jgi:hypothetical protein
VTVHGSRQRLAAFAAALVLALTLNAACTSGDSTRSETREPTSASATPTVDPKVADAEQQARAVYAGYIETWAIASQNADPDNPDLARYLADPLLTLTRRNVRRLKDIGAVQVGAQKATLRSVKVDLSANPPTVTIDSCLDYSNRKVVYRSNQAPVPNIGPPTPKISAVSKVTLHTTGQWLVSEVNQGSEPC